MKRAKVVKEKMAVKDTLFLAVYLETKNASLALLSEGEDRLGTLAVALPQQRGLVGPPLSSVMLGDRDVLIARILAERLSQRVKKIALVSVFTKTLDEREAGSIFLRLLEKTVRNTRSKEVKET